MHMHKQIRWPAFLILSLLIPCLPAGCKKGGESSSQSSSKGQRDEGGPDPKTMDILRTVGDNFLVHLSQGKIRRVYDLETTAGFRKKYSVEQFQLMVDQHPGLTQRPITLKINKLNGGNIEMNNGDKASIAFAEEEGVWKVRELTFP